MESLNVLLIGSGGREHALAWKMAQSPQLNKLFIAPGNPGTAQIGTNLAVKETDFEALKSAVISNDIQLIVVGPEAPLVGGIRDFFESQIALSHVKIVGPGKEGAQLEGSKSFSKEFMMRHNIPTASYGKFEAEDINEAKMFLKAMEPPYVLKADGLAAGKGVLIIDSIEEAEDEITNMLLGGKFGEASRKLVIEEFLQGIELSLFALCDGKDYVLLPSAKDYKRIGEGDTGLNTGGMGSISPVPFADETFMKKVEDKIVKPTINGLKSDGIDYLGFIFVGLISVNGEPFVIEYNCRMGDPETESVMPRVKSDLLELLWKTANGQLSETKVEIDDRQAATVILVSGGYPENYSKGKEINIHAHDHDQSILFHAGTEMKDDKLVTNGGRVMAVTSLGTDFRDALNKSYAAAQGISYEGMYYRKDLGFDLK